MTVRNLVVIGASAGGVTPLMELVSGLDPAIPAAVCVTVHVTPNHRSRLPEILTRAGPVPAQHAVHGEPIEEGRIYVAPPDRHLRVQDGHVELDRGARENRTRPAIDPLFRTAARAYGSNLAGVLLSGTQGDGTVGLMAVKAYGGFSVVQDPDEVQYSEMPRRAIYYGTADHVAPVRDIPALLMGFLESTTPGRIEGEEQMDEATKIVYGDLARQTAGERVGQVSTYSCPDCGGTLWQFSDDGADAYHCHVGHRYSAEALLLQKSESIESALWSAVRALVEDATLKRSLATRARQAGNIGYAASLEEQAQVNDEQMRLIRDAVLGAIHNGPSQVARAEQT